MLKQLIKIANELDQKGQHDLASEVDAILKDLTEVIENKRMDLAFMDQPDASTPEPQAPEKKVLRMERPSPAPETTPPEAPVSQVPVSPGTKEKKPNRLEEFVNAPNYDSMMETSTKEEERKEIERQLEEFRKRQEG